MNIVISIIFYVLAAISVIYGLVVRLSGSGTGFFIIWLLMGIAFLLIGIIFSTGLIDKINIWIKRIAFIAFAAGIILFIVVELFIVNDFSCDEKENLDYIIVLGAQVYDYGPSVVLKYRLDRAVCYLKENEKTMCIVSGGKGYNEPWSEAAGMKDYLVKNGIDETRIIMEDKSDNTSRNFEYSLQTVDLADCEVGVVTNNFHMFRALKIAKKKGIDNVYGIPSKSTWFYLPNNMLREFLGVIKDKVVGNM